MHNIEFVDEAVIQASPGEVFAAIEDLTAGRAQWWLPRVEVRPIRAGGEDLAGAEFELLARKPRGPATRLTVAEVHRPHYLRYEYLSGVMLGHGRLTITDQDGSTLLTYATSWTPKSWIQGRLLKPILRYTHSGLFMPAYFQGLASYLRGRRNQHR